MASWSTLVNNSLTYNNLPYPRNPRFFGRDESLDAIHAQLSSSDTQLVSVSLRGLGGIGKTQTALEYAYRWREDYGAIFWINAETASTTRRSFSEIATNTLGLNDAHERTLDMNVALILNWLRSTPERWLLIFDHVEDQSILETHWPSDSTGAVLVTTRALTSMCSTEILSRGFSIEQSVNMLLNEVGRHTYSDVEIQAAHNLSIELDGLPLALVQMAGQMRVRSKSFLDFYRMFMQHRDRLLGTGHSTLRLGYQNTVASAFQMSFAQLTDEEKAALGAISFLSPESIPLELFDPSDPDLLSDDLAFCQHPQEFDEVLDKLEDHGLVNVNHNDNTLQVHRLVQSEFRGSLKDPQQHFEAAIALIMDKTPADAGSTGWADYNRLVPHLEALSRVKEQSTAGNKPLVSNTNFVH